MVYLEDLREIVCRLEADKQKMDNIMSSIREIDDSLSLFVFDNKYSNILATQIDFLLGKLLNQEILDWVNWYLYDVPCFHEGENPNCSVDGVEYVVTDLDSFVDFAKHALKLPMRPKHENV